MTHTELADRFLANAAQDFTGKSSKWLTKKQSDWMLSLLVKANITPSERSRNKTGRVVYKWSTPAYEYSAWQSYLNLNVCLSKTDKATYNKIVLGR